MSIPVVSHSRVLRLDGVNVERLVGELWKMTLSLPDSGQQCSDTAATVSSHSSASCKWSSDHQSSSHSNPTNKVSLHPINESLSFPQESADHGKPSGSANSPSDCTPAPSLDSPHSRSRQCLESDPAPFALPPTEERHQASPGDSPSELTRQRRVSSTAPACRSTPSIPHRTRRDYRPDRPSEVCPAAHPPVAPVRA